MYSRRCGMYPQNRAQLSNSLTSDANVWICLQEVAHELWCLCMIQNGVQANLSSSASHSVVKVFHQLTHCCSSLICQSVFKMILIRLRSTWNLNWNNSNIYCQLVQTLLQQVDCFQSPTESQVRLNEGEKTWAHLADVYSCWLLLCTCVCSYVWALSTACSGNSSIITNRPRKGRAILAEAQILENCCPLVLSGCGLTLLPSAKKMLEIPKYRFNHIFVIWWYILCVNGKTCIVSYHALLFILLSFLIWMTLCVCRHSTNAGS